MHSDIPTPRIVVSKRAKGVRLRVCPFRGFSISVPPRFSRRELPAIINRQREWIEKSLEQARAYRYAALADLALPDEIVFPATGEQWTITWEREAGSRLTYDAQSGIILLSTPERDSLVSRELMRRFLLARARTHLGPLLQGISSECGLPFGRMSVRLQATRWGSCSAKGNISLNARLLFLDPPLVRHILLHELAHTKVMSHSPEFRSLMSRLSPCHADLDRQMRRAVNIPPKWSDPRLEPTRLPPL